MQTLDERVWRPESNFGKCYRPMIEQISDEQLRPIVAAMAGRAVKDFSWHVDRGQEGKKGFYGYKLIPLFHWETASGETGSCRCCLKQVSPPESIHYTYLREFGLPLCRLYGSIPLAEDEEIVFLEYLERVGHEGLDSDGREWLLQVKARLNAVPVRPAYREQLDALADRARRGREGQASPSLAQYLDRLFTLAGAGILGPDFARLARTHGATIPEVISFALDIHRQVEAMPMALSNKEIDVGYLPGTNERRCLDWHSTHLAPRYLDLRQSIGCPPSVSDGWGDAWEPQEQYARVYAEAFNELSEEKIGAEEVMRGAHLLWVDHALDPDWSNWFLDRAVSGEEGIRDNLLAVMTWVLAEVGRG